MNITTSVRFRAGVANVIRNLIDAGPETGIMQLYTGPQAPGADYLLNGQALLATVSFSSPCAPESVDGSLVFDPIKGSEAVENGRAKWARVMDSEGNVVMDCDVTPKGEGGVVQINTTDIVKGGPVNINSFSLIIPALGEQSDI